MSQWYGAHPNGSSDYWWHGQQWWTCGVCVGWCTGETKKCKRCRCKKSYAQVAAARPTAAGWGTSDNTLEKTAVSSKGAEIRQQLEQLKCRAMPLMSAQGTPTTKLADDEQAVEEVGK